MSLSFNEKEIIESKSLKLYLFLNKIIINELPDKILNDNNLIIFFCHNVYFILTTLNLSGFDQFS